ncbi:MAG: tetratricopeptide repeat protein [Chloroflexi bacterium]|nr:tetratricopeptide repeat protein [Chloroflexota bacterium]
MLIDLIIKAKDILNQEQPTDQALMETENALSAYLEALATERISEPIETTDLEHAHRLLREVRRERSRRLAEAQAQTANEIPEQASQVPTPMEVDVPAVSPQLGEDDAYDPLKSFLPASHNPRADALMDEAEEAFYAGNYQKAIPLYEKVLEIEPAWSRAQEHRDEAEEFLRSGNIPSVALPPNAGKAFGKAQSAARVFRYQTALDYLDEAFASLKEAGISRWREGEELRQDLENQMQAHEVYQEGLGLLAQGDLQGGLSKIQAAASAVVLPEYVDKAAEIRADLMTLDQIADVVNLSGSVPPEILADTRQELDRLSIKYSEIPRISRLRSRLEVILPNVVASLIEYIQRQIRQAESASSLKIAIEAYTASEQGLATLQILQPENPLLRTLEADIQNAQAEMQVLENSLDRAGESLTEESRFFPRDAFLISEQVRKRFPQDPNVLGLKRKLRWYYVSLFGGGTIALTLISLALWFGGRGIAGAVRNHQLARTPSPTITASLTPTGTITPTPTETATPGPTATETPYYTPSPTPIITGTVLRNLFVRQSCYEAFPATGRLSEGDVVTLIAIPNRVFDDLNRECVLVEHREDTTNVIGYILIMDLSFP